MNFGLIVVGDEILSGKRQDKHFAKVVELLVVRGLRLSWAEYVGDERERLAATLQRSFASGDAVFCCGGIGATPDDHTRQAAAMALGLGLELHPEAASLIAGRVAETAAAGTGSADMSLPENQRRLDMGRFPAGARIIPNPYNRIPGFEIGNHFFVPGFPVMAWPMIEWVLEHRFADRFHRERRGERSFLAYEIPEADVIPLLEQIEREFPGIRVFSLPSVGENGQRRHIELGVKGPEHLLAPACARLLEGTRALGAQIE